MIKKIFAILILSMFLLTSISATSAINIKSNNKERKKAFNSIGEINPIWAKSWKVADQGNDHGEDIAIDEKHGYIYVSGRGQSLDDRLFYNFLLQYDVDGKLQWYKILSKDEFDCGTSVCIDEDSFVYVSYNTGKEEEGEFLYMLKYDRFGNEIWSEPKICLEVGQQKQILIRSSVTDGNYVYMTGEIWGTGIGIYLLKTGIDQEDGCHQIAYWSLSDCQDYADSIIIHDNYIYISGCSSHNNNDFLDAIILKYDTNGALQWNLSFRYDTRTSVKSIVIHENNLYIAGSTGILDDYWNIYLMKYDLNGNQLWSEPVIWGEEFEEWFFSRSMTIDDEYIFIAGELVDYFGGASYDSTLLLRFNLDGDFDFAKIWVYGPSTYDIQSYDDHLYISGIGGIVGLDVFLLKCDYNGDHGSNARPSAPDINGELKGSVGRDYEYTLISTDPEGEDVYYHIYWGDGEVDEWIGPYPSGEEIRIKHTWLKKGTYTVRAKTQDIDGVESYWESLKVIMPRTRFVNNFLIRLLDQFPTIQEFLNL